MKVKVKICGIRNVEEALIAVDADVDFLGLQFVPTSKRKISFSIAQIICKKFKGKIKLVGVFRDQSLKEIKSICEELQLDYVQLHGIENMTFCNQMSIPVIKKFGLPADFAVTSTMQQMQKYDVRYHLIDRVQQGTGEMLSLHNAALLAQKFPLFFAGDLNHMNVSSVVKVVKPFAVDVASGIETDGEIDIEKMKLFIKNAKGVVL